MILRFSSGSLTPSSAFKNRSDASTTVKFTPSSRKAVSTSCGFTHAQQAVIDEDGGELIADGSVQEETQSARVHPARYP